jgi:hypothetical protein
VKRLLLALAALSLAAGLTGCNVYHDDEKCAFYTDLYELHHSGDMRVKMDKYC